MRIPLLLVFILACFHLSAQRLENIRAEALNGGEKVIITYDLNGGSANQKFKVSVYSSHNNYSTPLSLVSGDITDVTPGPGKRIEWNAKSEMVEYSGDVTFELRADPVVAALAVRTPTGVKKGKTATINYEGVMSGESVKIELVRNGVAVNQVGTTSDPYKYSWSVPLDVEKGSDYQVRITAGSRTATSGSFAVKSKSKAWMYIVPAVVVTGVVVFLVTKPKSGGGSKDLPTPPDPATGN
jgi:hypothetical protein